MNPIKDTISYMMALTARRHRQYVQTNISQLGLHVGQELFLLQLWQQDGQTQTELAACNCLQPATITRMIQRLEESGLVERHKDADDQRVWRVFLTEAGKALEAKVQAQWNAIDAQLTAGMIPEERLLARRLLLQMYDNLATHPVKKD